MGKFSRVFIAAIALCVASSTVALACHSNYFDEIFTKIQKLEKKGDLTADQMAMVFKYRAEFNKQKSLDHTNGFGCSKHDSHVPQFIAAAAGVLNDDQFKTVTGKGKTEVQKLRFEVNELKKELAEIKKLLKALQTK